jgi:hypothetical protein
MAELQHKYDLRPREKSSTNIPPKNILSRSKANEAVVTKPSTETQVSLTKQVETRTVQSKKLKIQKQKFKPEKLKKQLWASI